MSRYASATGVPVEKSKSEIERVLLRYKAKEFASGWKDGRAVVQFSMNGRIIRFVLTLPRISDQDITFVFDGRSRRNRERNETQKIAALNQAILQRWRALLLSIKAKLESSESGIESFESAFMAQTVLPSGITVAEEVLPKIATAYELGIMPLTPMLE